MQIGSPLRPGAVFWIAVVLLLCLAVSPAGAESNVVAWGRNDSGECNVPAGLIATQVTTGNDHSLALRPDGTVVAWGWNDYGQCNVPANLVATQISAGTYKSVALRPDGTVVEWGRLAYGAPTGLIATQISAAAHHILALRPDGTVVGWSGGSGFYNYFGEATPPPGLIATQVAAGNQFSVALRPDGSVVVWGYTSNGQNEVPEGLVATQIAAGFDHVLALRPDGSVVAWGRNDYGQCNVPDGLVATQIAADAHSSFALRPDGTVVAWGGNDYGQCNVPDGLLASSISGGFHSLAIDATPMASFVASTETGTAPLAVQFTDTSIGTPTAWLWEFGDGETSALQNPSHTYTEPGLYTVTLTVTNAYGSDTETKTDHIRVAVDGPIYVQTYVDLCKVGTWRDGWAPHSEYIQTADIQCPAGVSFTPIGVWEDDPFTGSYDGRGHVIRDLYINRPDGWDVGLFGEVEDGAVITNVTLEEFSITAGDGVGGLVGCLYGEGAIIENCTVSGTISGGKAPIGGLIGYAEYSTITDCHADVKILGEMIYEGGGLYEAGGLIGETYCCNVTSCSAQGDITYADEYVGGLIGYCCDSTITDCHAHGDVTIDPAAQYQDGPNGGLVGYLHTSSAFNCSATGDVIGGEWATGGLVGFGYRATVARCYASGNVSGYEHVGGLIGYYEPRAENSLEDCYATGNVVSSGSYAGYCSAGGLIGLWDQYQLVLDGHIKNVYSTGSVSAPNLPAEAVGGLIGQIDYGTGVVATAAYWDTETSGQATSAGGAVGKTTAELQTLATFANWSIATPATYTDEVWYLVPGKDYPRLAWEGLPTPEEPTPTATPTPGTLPGPLPVRFVVQTYTGQALDNITVTATPLESTGPWSWLYDLFGISGDADLNGTALAGTTDTGGGIVFSLIQTVKYRVTVTDASRGIDTSITLYPQEDAVVISVWPQEPAGSAGDFTLYAEEEAAGTRVGVRYAAAGVTRVTFTVKDEAGAVLYTRTSAAPEDDLSYLLDGEPGEVFTYGYAGEHPEYGRVQKDQFIRFEGEARPLIDLAPWIPLAAYHWASVFILVGFAMTFVRGEIRGALLTIPILAGTLWLIGWLQVPWLLVGVALVIGVLIYTRMGESDLGL